MLAPARVAMRPARALVLLVLAWPVMALASDPGYGGFDQIAFVGSMALVPAYLAWWLRGALRAAATP